MSPQVGKGFNRDKWNELEKHMRYEKAIKPTVTRNLSLQEHGSTLPQHLDMHGSGIPSKTRGRWKLIREIQGA